MSAATFSISPRWTGEIGDIVTVAERSTLSPRLVTIAFHLHVSYLAGLLVVIGLAVKLFDLKRKRESEAVQLQAQLSDALLREPSLAGLPLTPTVHVPMWTGTPATIDVTGQVPKPELKDLALRLVSDEASRIRSDIKIVDRLSIVPTAAQAA